MIQNSTRFRCIHKAFNQSRHYTSNQTVQAHDVLFLRQHGVKHAKWHITNPLRPDSKVKLSYGASINASDLIGKKILDRVKDSRGNSVVLYEPTLASYIVNSERLATPIYPHDASTIVNLMDLNLERHGDAEPCGDEEPFEIFEAGTGMGSLTLHIARAIQVANPPLPPKLRQAITEAALRRDKDMTIPPGLHLNELEGEYEEYLKSRKAILHTLDRNSKHTRGAYKLVRGFRRAQYLSNVDFHIGSIDEYITKRLEKSNGKPFLSRAVLDLPSAQEYSEQLIKALHFNAVLVLFNPSISQIADFHTWVIQQGKPIRLEKVLELPVTSTKDGVHDGAGGGRHWDVKTVIPKAALASGDAANVKPVQVMRPKVGDRVGGGGFVAVFRRWPEEELKTLEPAEVIEEAEEAVESEAQDEHDSATLKN